MGLLTRCALLRKQWARLTLSLILATQTPKKKSPGKDLARSENLPGRPSQLSNLPSARAMVSVVRSVRPAGLLGLLRLLRENV